MTHQTDANPPFPLARLDRRIGLELEFSGLSEAATAHAVADATDARASQVAANRWCVDTATFGEIEIYLDTTIDDTVEDLTGTKGRDMLREVVPVELVTDPFPTTQLSNFDKLVAHLRDAGAKGSGDGLLLGFGLHLNVEVRDMEAAYLARVLAAYALLEAWLRDAVPIDRFRRMLPFVAPYPDSLIDALTGALPLDLDALTDLYLTHTPSRNHGLDLLPILAEHDPVRVRAGTKGSAELTARPAFHFRLPDCRIDETNWSVGDAWDQWRLVETVATDPTALARLQDARHRWADQSALTRPAWAKASRDALGSPDAGDPA